MLAGRGVDLRTAAVRRHGVQLRPCKVVQLWIDRNARVSSAAPCGHAGARELASRALVMALILPARRRASGAAHQVVSASRMCGLARRRVACHRPAYDRVAARKPRRPPPVATDGPVARGDGCARIESEACETRPAGVCAEAGGPLQPRNVCKQPPGNSPRAE